MDRGLDRPTETIALGPQIDEGNAHALGVHSTTSRRISRECREASIAPA